MGSLRAGLVVLDPDTGKLLLDETMLPAETVFTNTTNPFTVRQEFDAPVTLDGSSLADGGTRFQVNSTMQNPDNIGRPVSWRLNYQIAPTGSAPAVITDYHGFDLSMTIPATANASINSKVRLYAAESAINHAGSQTIGSIVALYGYPGVTGGGSITGDGAVTLRANVQAIGGSTINNYFGVWYDAPSMDSTSTITAWYGLYVNNVYIGPSVGTLSGGPLSTGGPIVSIALQAPLAANVPAGFITLSSGFNAQQFPTAGALAGASSIPVTSTTPNFAFPAGSTVSQQPGTVGTAYGMFSKLPLLIANSAFTTQAAIGVQQYSSGAGISIIVEPSATSASSYALQITQSAGVAAQAVVVTQNTAAQAITVIQTQAAAGIQINQQASGNALFVNSNASGGVGIQVSQAAAAVGVQITQNGATHGLSIGQNANGDAIHITTATSTGAGVAVVANGGSATSYCLNLTQNSSTAAVCANITQNVNAVGLLVTNATTAESATVTFKKLSTGSAVAAKFTNAGTGDCLQIQFGASNTNALRITGAGSVVTGIGAALANAATDGFLYMPTVAGTPTGVPTAQTGSVAHVYDTTANKIWVYNGSWRATAALT